MNAQMERDLKIDWIEKKTAELLKRANRSRYFQSIIDDAKAFELDGYVWDVALAMSCSYWLS